MSNQLSVFMLLYFISTSSSARPTSSESVIYFYYIFFLFSFNINNSHAERYFMSKYKHCNSYHRRK